MQKIYLAISNNEDADSIVSNFNKYKKNKQTELNTILVEDKNNLKKVMDTDFDLCVVDHSFVNDIKDLHNPHNRKVWYIHPSNPPHNKKDEDEVLTLFRNKEEVNTWIMIRRVRNPNLSNEKSVHKTTNQPITKVDQAKQSKDSMDAKPNDLQQNSNLAAEENNSNTAVEKGIVKPIDEDSTKQEIDDKYEEQDINDSNPIELGPDYPATILKSFHTIDNELDRRVKDARRKYNEDGPNDNHVIGIWSPLHRSGVTTLLTNFAIYLAKMNMKVAVLEAMTKYPLHKTILKRFTEVPKDWISYVEVLKKPQPKKSLVWKHFGVSWNPLNDVLLSNNNNQNWEWNTPEVLASIKILEFNHQFTLIDLPTGEMDARTLSTLNFLDELWIVADSGAYQQLKGWKRNIHEHILSQEGMKVRLIFNKQYPFSKVEQIADYLDIDYFVNIPDLTKELMKNQFEKKPLIESLSNSKKLIKPFNQLALDIVGINTIKEHLPPFSILKYKLKKLYEENEKQQQLQDDLDVNGSKEAIKE